MTKLEVISQLLNGKSKIPCKKIGVAFAPTNIALVKYWGKRDEELNLPNTDSLSITLPNYGTRTTISLSDQGHDEVILNHIIIDRSQAFYLKVSSFLDLFRPKDIFFQVNTVSDVPVAAGLASSASGFAALVLCLNDFFGWELSLTELSILARLGSGSACRSLWNGFVKWQQGNSLDGLDSHGVPIDTTWPTLCLGLLLLSTQEKPVSSRAAMQITAQTSLLYRSWPAQVNSDMEKMQRAILQSDFDLLGMTAENNALAMHATMAAGLPPVIYSLPQTLALMHQIWQLRKEGLPIYFTQDAGPNLKLLFLQQHAKDVQSIFANIQMTQLF